MQGCSPSHSRPHRFGSKSRHLRSRLRVNEGALEGREARLHAQALAHATRPSSSARVTRRACRRVDASTRRAATGDARRASFVAGPSPPRTRVDRDPGDGEGGFLFSAAAEPPPKQARTPTRRKLDMPPRRRGERARTTRCGRERPARAATRAGTDAFANQTVPASVSRLSASACGVCCSGTWCARWTRCIFCARWSAARPRSRATPARGVRSGFKNPFIRVGDQESLSPSEKLPATKRGRRFPRGSGSRKSAENEHLVGRACRRAPQRREPRHDTRGGGRRQGRRQGCRRGAGAPRAGSGASAAGSATPGGAAARAASFQDGGRDREERFDEAARTDFTRRQTRRQPIADRTRTRAFTPGSKPTAPLAPPRRERASVERGDGE